MTSEGKAMRIAAWQMQVSTGDIAANLARIASGAAEAAAGGAALLIVPELAVTGYSAGEAFSALASPPAGAMHNAIAQIAQRNDITIVAGFAEHHDSVIYNSAILTDGASEPAVYRKSHLYGDYERKWFAPEAPSTVLARVGDVRLGMLICYDVEFPENVRRLAMAGAELIVVPTALPKGSSDRFIADKMIPVRAFENQVFVAYVNHCGADDKFTYAGLSRISAPDGKLLAEGPAEGEALLFADIDPTAYAKSRMENNYLTDLVRRV
jgi:predicted amidohydrolase